MSGTESTSKTVLPNFRADLELYEGPLEADGSPTYSIYDPIQDEYFKISWSEAMIIKEFQPGMTIDTLLEKLHKNTTLQVSEEEIKAFFAQLGMQGLLDIKKSGEQIFQEKERKKSNLFQWFIINYLFIKIPLVNPDQFLKRTVHYFMPLMTKTAFILYCIITFLGFFFLITSWSTFIYTFPYFFNTQGVLAYGVAIIFTKIVHELSHAYTAKKYGLRVPTMGVAFLVLWPVLYTDATDAWRLPDRRQRLVISAAGIIAELLLAGLSTIGWAFTSPGILNSVFFILASTNWVRTLLINVNPALRYDGYYILSDLLGVDNLQTRAFALLRTEGYRFVFGMQLPNPEPDMKKSKQILLIIYAIYTWVYRVFLYTAIALFVYYEFTKALGIFLFVVEVWIFLLYPVVYELQMVYKLRSKIQWNRRTKITTSLLAASLFYLIVPLPHYLSFEAVTIPVNNQTIFSPSEGIIEKIHVKRGNEVEKGAVLLKVQNPVLDHQIASLQKDLQILEKKLKIIKITDDSLPLYVETQAQHSQKEAELDGYLKKQQQTEVTASISGIVYQWDEMLHENQPIKKNEVLGQLATKQKQDIACFVPERDIDVIKERTEATFNIRASRETFSAHIQQISPIRAKYLRYPELASLYGGNLPVHLDQGKKLEFVESFYLVTLSLDTPEPLRYGEVGTVTIRGPWQSKLIRIFRSVFSAIMGESGF